MREIPVWLPGEPSRERLESCDERALPDFLLIGAQRSGTTSLYDAVCAHPQVAPAVMKEIHYFDAWYDRGRCWYRAHFPRRSELDGSGQQLVTGEATPYLLFDPRAADRVAETLGSPALIAILRDPVERARSHYHHQRRRGHESLDSFEAAVDEELSRGDGGELPDGPARSDRDRSYLARGRYAEQLPRWIATFGRQRLLVLFSSDLAARPGATVATVWRHLGLESHGLTTVPGRHVATGTPEMPEEVRDRLRRYFEPWDDRLSQLLDVELPWR